MKSALLAILLLGAVIVTAAAPGSAKTVRFAWDANTESDLAGYTFYWGIIASGTTNSAAVTTNTITLSNLANGQYWFGVTARNTNNLESDLSNIVTASIPRNPSNLRIQ
jgi:hypothetical protein